MKIRRAAILFLLLGLGLSLECPSQDFRSDDLVGTYVKGTFLNWNDASRPLSWDLNTKLKMLKDGTYTIGNDCQTTSGVFILTHGILTLKPGVSGPSHCFYSFPVTKANEELLKRSPEPTDKRMTLIPWSDRRYLIEESGWENFINAINIGLLPNTYRERNLYMGAFYSRIEDENKVVSGLPDLPANWKSLILSKPVVGTIIAVRKVNEYELVLTIDKGSRDGLRKGLPILIGDAVPDWLGTAFVESVETTRSDLKVFSTNDIKIGTGVTTHFVRPPVEQN